jgi:hypothetical protein
VRQRGSETETLGIELIAEADAARLEAAIWKLLWANARAAPAAREQFPRLQKQSEWLAPKQKHASRRRWPWSV